MKTLKNRSNKETLKAYEDLYTKLSNSGLVLKLHILDNEASIALKRQIKASNTNYQLVEAHNHQVIEAERGIRIFKNCYISGLASTNLNFPIYLWDKLLEQAEITLNLLCNSRQHPHLSAYTNLNGIFNLNRTPMAPPGTKVVLYKSPDKRESWAPHGKLTWYIGPVMEHYHNMTYYIPETDGTRKLATAQFFPYNQTLPHISNLDALTIAVDDLI